MDSLLRFVGFLSKFESYYYLVTSRTLQCRCSILCKKQSMINLISYLCKSFHFREFVLLYSVKLTKITSNHLWLSIQNLLTCFKIASNYLYCFYVFSMNKLTKHIHPTVMYILFQILTSVGNSQQYFTAEQNRPLEKRSSAA